MPLFFYLYVGVDKWNANYEEYTLDLKNGNYAKMRQCLNKQTGVKCWTVVWNNAGIRLKI